MSNIKHFALDVLQNTRFHVSHKCIENVRQKGSNNESKVELWAFRGLSFKFSEGFWRGLIFDDFSIGKKSAENLTFAI